MIPNIFPVYPDETVLRFDLSVFQNLFCRVNSVGSDTRALKTFRQFCLPPLGSRVGNDNVQFVLMMPAA